LVLLMVLVVPSFTVPVSAANYTLSVTVTPTSSGTVTLAPGGGSYAPNTNVVFTAKPNVGYYFAGWGISLPDSTQGDGGMYYYTWVNPASKVMDGNLRLLAYFQPVNQWVRYTGNPVVAGGSWNSWAWQPRMFTYPNGTYGMAFIGGCVNSEGPCVRAFGLATSPEGLHWTVYPSPILRNGTGSDWDSYGGSGRNQMSLGSVFWNGTKYLLYYSASDGTQSGFGLATSDDTINWTKYPENPILTNSTEYAQSSGDCQNYSPQFRDPDVLMVGGTYMMFYMRGGAIRAATSADGINWDVQNNGCHVLMGADGDDPGTWPYLPHAYSWDGDFIYSASVRYDPLAENFKMFYTGCDVDCAILRTGFAVSSTGIGDSWTKYVGNPVIGPMPGGFDNSDLVGEVDFLPENGTLLLYYSADTANSQMCNSDYDCIIQTSIGLASVSEVPLVGGWNLVSLHVVPISSDIKSVLGPLLTAGEVTSVWTYASTGKAMAWQYFTPTGKSTLKTMADGNGYWIYMTVPDTLLVGGYVIAPGSVPPSYSLVTGWNLVGFKPQPTVANETAGAYLTSINGAYDRNSVWIYENLGGNWIRATDSTWLRPGQAMWIYVTSTTATTLRP
jgi:hypothetical protein